MPPIAKHKKRKPKVAQERDNGWLVAGFDTSQSCLAGAAIAWDATLRRHKGPVFTIERWQKGEDYLSRIRKCGYSFELLLDLKHKLGVITDSEYIFIGQEEPWPFGMAGGSTSSYLKQQAEISGAFLAGMLRFGYANVMQMNSMRWRKTVADDLGITTHHSKWQDPALVKMYNCIPKDTGKFRSKQWALDSPPFAEKFYAEIPDLPDIIKSKDGNIPRPEGSVAKAIQPADEYDALAIMWTLYLELEQSGLLAK